MTLLHNNQQQITPYERFYLAIRSSGSKKQYLKRLQKFLDFLEIKGSTIDERCQKCYNLIKGNTSEENEDLIFKFIMVRRAILE